jgi:hypothetical protein
MRKALPKNRAQSGQSDQSGVRRAIAAGARGACVAAIAVGTVAGAGLVTGCAVSESDVVRWERTERGPYKLVAVITHDKYSWQLRVDSAISLIRMPARGGRRMGISYLCDHYQDEDGSDKEGALVQLSEDARKKVVDGMVPEMLKAMQTPPPVKKADGTIDADESIPFKDAAYAMLSHEPSLVTDPKAHDEIIAALSTWVQTDFENRMENNSQQYGIEQIMHFLGPSSVKSLPTLINESSTKVDKISQLVADIGDADAKQKTADALVALAKRFDSQAWVDKEKPIVQDSDVKGGQKVTPAQLDAQLKQFQDQQMTSTFGSMKRIGTRPIIDYCINYASNGSNSKERRQAALAALEGRIDKNNTGDTDKLFAIAKDDNTPDEVRDLAFARLGELPKEIMVPKLYTLFETKKWKVRWVAGTNILKTMSTKDVPDFLKHLPTTPATKAGHRPDGREAPAGRGQGEGRPGALPDDPRPRPEADRHLVLLRWFQGRPGAGHGSRGGRLAGPEVRQGRRLRLVVRRAQGAGLAGDGVEDDRDGGGLREVLRGAVDDGEVSGRATGRSVAARELCICARAS